MPLGRKPVKSFYVNESYRARVYNFIKKELNKGFQGYIVCPLVEDNESDLISVKEYYKEFQTAEMKEIDDMTSARYRLN